MDKSTTSKATKLATLGQALVSCMFLTLPRTANIGCTFLLPIYNINCDKLTQYLSCMSLRKCWGSIPPNRRTSTFNPSLQRLLPEYFSYNSFTAHAGPIPREATSLLADIMCSLLKAPVSDISKVTDAEIDELILVICILSDPKQQQQQCTSLPSSRRFLSPFAKPSAQGLKSSWNPCVRSLE